MALEESWNPLVKSKTSAVMTTTTTTKRVVLISFLGQVADRGPGAADAADRVARSGPYECGPLTLLPAADRA